VAESRDDLRQRYVDAIRAAAFPGLTVQGAADAALSVRDDELHELRATVAGLNYTVGRLIEQVSEADVRAEHAEAELECLRVAVNPTKVGAVNNLVSSATRLIRVERDDARTALARVRAIPRLPHSSEQDGVQGRAYTRGWQSVIDALDRALDVPGDGGPEATDGR
jgi:hypothetical protein